jgi:pyridinium-3,5-bisthiocarboxylic acid mononucleotide nickel chelatase
MPFIALLDPFSGIAGDMMLGALVDAGLDPDWLRALPARLGLDGVEVRIQRVLREGIACTKVDFDIPPQPHGRHITQIRAMVASAGVPDGVRERADAAFTAIAEAEGEIHGVAPEKVHLHEVGAVDAILDIVGSVWGLQLLDVDTVYCGPIVVGDGTVKAAHGILPVPAPATLALLEGHVICPGPEGAGELVTPTGAALVRALSSGPFPASYTPVRIGYGAGTKELAGRANALRIVIAEPALRDGVLVESLVLLATDIDDMDGESLSALAESLREEGALDVVLLATQMKKGRPGTRLEALCTTASADRIEHALFVNGSSIGVRRSVVERHALPREERTVLVQGEAVRIKRVTLPGGGSRSKPEFDDVRRLATRLGTPLRDVAAEALAASERLGAPSVPSPATGSSPASHLLGAE